MDNDFITKNLLRARTLDAIAVATSSKSLDKVKSKHGILHLEKSLVISVLSNDSFYARNPSDSNEKPTMRIQYNASGFWTLTFLIPTIDSSEATAFPKFEGTLSVPDPSARPQYASYLVCQPEAEHKLPTVATDSFEWYRRKWQKPPTRPDFHGREHGLNL